MNSQGWKVSLFAIAAVVALSACGEKKKPKAGSPYSGIWINQEATRDYSLHSSELNAGNYARFCPKVYRNARRYGDSDYRVRILSVQGNGEVLLYAPGDAATSLGYRENNFRGSVNAAGNFTPGSIGPDGRVAGWVGNGYGLPGSDELASPATFSINPSNRDVMRVFVAGDISFMRRSSRAIADEYYVHATTCLVELKKHCESSRRGKDHDPSVDRRSRRFCLDSQGGPDQFDDQDIPHPPRHGRE